MNKHLRILRMVIASGIIPISITMMVSILLLSCVQPQSKPHEGAYKLAYWQSISGDTLTSTFPGDITGSGMKIWTKDYFCFLGRYEKDTTIVDSYGGGTYTLNGNQYEETLLYYGNQERIGSKTRMFLEVKGDSLIQTYPLDDNWQLDKSNYRIEKWIRLE